MKLPASQSPPDPTKPAIVPRELGTIFAKSTREYEFTAAGEIDAESSISIEKTKQIQRTNPDGSSETRIERIAGKIQILKIRSRGCVRKPAERFPVFSLLRGLLNMVFHRDDSGS